MAWTVGELKEELDGWGDHIPVRIVANRGESNRIYAEFDVSEGHDDGQMVIELEIDQM
jgi:hypothetical protein